MKTPTGNYVQMTGVAGRASPLTMTAAMMKPGVQKITDISTTSTSLLIMPTMQPA